MRKGGQDVPSGYYKIENMVRAASGSGEVGVCGTCMDARGITAAELTADTKRSTLDGLTEWTQWADRVLVF